MSTVERAQPKATKFNRARTLPFNLRPEDFELAMQDVYDFLHDLNDILLDKNLRRLEDVSRPQAFSGLMSDLLTDALATHARSLTVNTVHNGHPDLLVDGAHPNNGVMNGAPDKGIEVKATKKKNKGQDGAVDTHGARDQWMCVFVREADLDPAKTAVARQPTVFREVYLGEIVQSDFRENARKTAVGTRTATLHEDGLKKLRPQWVYLDL